MPQSPNLPMELELKPEVYELPLAAVSSLGDPGLRFELHGISFSHYVDKARWALRLCGLTYKEYGYLPLIHIPPVVRLLKRFKQRPGKPTASSNSPSATPLLAVYAADGTPLFLLQNSSLIARYAALHAAKLAGAPAAATQLYGPSLAVDAQRLVGGSDDLYAHATQLELRIGSVIGVETRRLAYFHLLPCTSLAGALFVRNSGGGALASCQAWLSYLAARLLLPRFLNINAATAARGRERLLAEWDFFDGLLAAAQQEQRRYLCGPQLSGADVALAALGGVVVDVPPELAPPGVWMPGLEQMPPELRVLMQALHERPTGQYILRLWREHGPQAAVTKL